MITLVRSTCFQGKPVQQIRTHIDPFSLCLAVWFGAFTGIAVSILAGGVFAVVYYVAKSKLFQGTGKFIFQGVISYIACILITYLGFAMLRFANMERKVARKLDTAAQKVSKQTWHSLAEATANLE
jgi:FTR1 family protein